MTPNEKGKHKISMLLSRMKNKGLITNKKDGWYLADKGLKYLKLLNKHKPISISATS
mgnify:CR=1 FL=1